MSVVEFSYNTRAFSELAGRNVRIARVVREIGQADVADRMRALGFTTWVRQTVSQVERGRRRVTVDEAGALGIVLDVTIAQLLSVHGWPPA